MSEQEMSRRERQAARQFETVGNGGKRFKVLELPESVKELKLEIKKAVTVNMVPFPVTDVHPQFGKIMALHEKYGDPINDWVFEYTVHKNMPGLGEVICRKNTYGPQHRCPICEARADLIKEKNLDWKDPELDQFRFSKRAAYVVEVVSGDSDEFMILQYPQSWLHKELVEEGKKEGVLFLDETDAGKSVNLLPLKFGFKDNKTGATKEISGQCVVSFADREFGYSEEDLAEVPHLCDFFKFDTYEELYEKLHGVPVADATVDEPVAVAEEDKEIVDEGVTTIVKTDVATGEKTTTTEAAKPAGRSSRRHAGAKTEEATDTPTEEKVVTSSGRRAKRAPAYSEHDKDVVF